MQAILLAVVLWAGSAVPATPAATVAAVDPEAVRLAFAEVLRPGPGPLAPSDKLRSLDGKRVRVAGFMAELEEGPAGAFWLAGRPVSCDEGGAGIGDLPPDAILVVVPWSAGTAIPFVAGPVEVVGVLRLGAAPDVGGPPAPVRIVLDPPAARPEGGKAP